MQDCNAWYTSKNILPILFWQTRIIYCLYVLVRPSPCQPHSSIHNVNKRHHSYAMTWDFPTYHMSLNVHIILIFCQHLQCKTLTCSVCQWYIYYCIFFGELNAIRHLMQNTVLIQIKCLKTLTLCHHRMHNILQCKNNTPQRSKGLMPLTFPYRLFQVVTNSKLHSYNTIMF